MHILPHSRPEKQKGIMGEFARPIAELEPHTITRQLAEVDLLNAARLPDGSHDPAVLAATAKNAPTEIQEATQPYAVTRTEHHREDGDYWWGNQTTVDVAKRGQIFYQTPEGLVRGDIEVDEAEHTRDALRPGSIKVFLSPRMTRLDGTRETAELENLLEDDAVRTSQVVERDGGLALEMRSMLPRDVPISAWISMANDPNGLFGGRVQVPEAESALSLMCAHREMILPSEAVPDGPLSVLEAVVPYIDDPEVRAKVEEHIRRFRMFDQVGGFELAQRFGARIHGCIVEIADSLHDGRATAGVVEFIGSLYDKLNSDTKALVEAARLYDGSLGMNRELAAALMQARRHTVWVSAAVNSHNEAVAKQLPAQVTADIRGRDLQIQAALAAGDHERAAQLEAENDRQIASYKVKVGGGCPGKNNGVFEADSSDTESDDESDANCYIHTYCPCCSHLQEDGKPSLVRVKVLAFIDKTKTINCTRCKASAGPNGSKPGRIKPVSEAQPAPEPLANNVVHPVAVDGLAQRIKASKEQSIQAVAPVPA